MEVLAAKNWPTNGHLIADVAELGYLKAEWLTLDPTYGQGNWWTEWSPYDLVIHDKFSGPARDGVDFRNMPHDDGEFKAVAFDPPYKLNGTDQGEGWRYGVSRPMDWKAKMQMIREGITECARVLAKRGTLLVKCQDQVCSGKVRWQTIDFANHAHACGLDLVDRFDYFGGYRPQPLGRNQVHARGRGSTLLVFEKVS
jgi:hypothetical protein